jgi:AcrR family transcriptional regulator
MSAVGQRRAYHHGDLPTALIDAALDLISENGVQGFSLAEAARRSGVSISAPYRHFADRDELLAATAVRGYEELLARFEAVVAAEATPAEQLAAMSAAYVRFAAEQRPMFEVLFGAGLEKARYPRLDEAAGKVTDAICAIARRLVPDRDPELAWTLVHAIAGLSQGHATLLLDGMFGDSPAEAAGLAAERAAAATRALIRGRRLLFAAPRGAARPLRPPPRERAE